MPIAINDRTKSFATMPVPIASPPVLTPEHMSNLTLWLDAAKRDSFTFNGQNISAWRDRRGINSITQATAAQQPTYLPNGWRGNPAVFFRGSNVMTNTTWSMPTLFFTMAYVFVPSTTINQFARFFSCVPNPISGSDYSSTTAWYLSTPSSTSLGQSGNNSQRFFINALCNNTSGAGNQIFFEYGARRAYVLYCGAGRNLAGTPFSFFRVMGHNAFAGWDATAASSGVSIGAAWASGASFLPQSLLGYVLEVAVWSQPLTEFEMVGLDKYFAAKWNVDTTPIDGFFDPLGRLTSFRKNNADFATVSNYPPNSTRRPAFNFTY